MGQLFPFPVLSRSTTVVLCCFSSKHRLHLPGSTKTRVCFICKSNMSTFDEKLKLFAVDLYKINAIKFGEYKTKVGLITPVYCDLRVIVSYPQLLVSYSIVCSYKSITIIF